MARAGAQDVREVLPTGAAPVSGGGARSAPTRVQASVNFPMPGPGAFVDQSGAIIAEGLTAAGRGVSQLGAFYNDAAADEATNNYQDAVNKIMHGGVGPDGKQIPGFMSLRGKDAIDAAPKVQEDIDKLLNKIGDSLPVPASAKKFSDYSRRFRAITNAQIGQHTDTAYKTWMTGVNKSSEKLAIDTISNNANDEDQFLHGTADLISARVKQAQLMYGNDPTVILEAERGAKQDALEARLNVVAVENPARALRMLEANKSTMGAKYDNVYNKYRARADQQIGREAADSILGAQPLENGEDVKGVIRHFEGFKNRAYEDRSPGAPTAHRVGYGSDTVTRADGKVERVTPDTVVTKEDAERDLERRATISQNQARGVIGEEAWSKLDGRAKASLTSIAYNYGKLPDSVAAAARTGDKEKLAQSIEALSGHNAGINVRRRMQEAANVRGGSGSPTNQADAVDMIMNDPALKERPEAQAAAIARVNKSYALQQKQQTLEKAAFKTRVDDAKAEALTTGELTNPIPESDFIRQYGQQDGPNEYAKYTADVEYGAKYKSMQTMSALEINQMIDKSLPAPGTPGYARAVANTDRLRKGADALIQERREDPAGAVDRMQAVKDVRATVVANKPETFKALAQARLAQQEQLGVEEENRSPISKAEALTLMKPLRLMLPGEEAKTVRETYLQFEKLLGPDMAPDAFRYAVKAAKVASEGQAAAASVLQKLARGQSLTRSDARAADDAAEQSAIGGALTGTDYSGYGIGGAEAMFPTRPPSFEGSPVVSPRVVPPRAMTELLRDRNNPSAVKEFDEKYGTGRAQEILKKFPAPGGK